MEAHEFLLQHGLDPERGMDGYTCSSNGPGSLFAVRDEYVGRFGFSVPCREAVVRIASYAPILEVGAGCGYWAYELVKAGADIKAIDKGTGRYKGLENGWLKTWLPVEQLTALEAIKKYPKRALMLVWPDLHDEWASQALAVYRGPTVIYIGEYKGACATKRFFDLLERGFRKKEYIRIPQFWGLHDGMWIFSRRLVHNAKLRANRYRTGEAGSS